MDTVFLHGDVDLDTLLRHRYETIAQRKDWTVFLVPFFRMGHASHSHYGWIDSVVLPGRGVSVNVRINVLAAKIYLILNEKIKFKQLPQFYDVIFGNIPYPAKLLCHVRSSHSCHDSQSNFVHVIDKRLAKRGYKQYGSDDR